MVHFPHHYKLQISRAAALLQHAIPAVTAAHRAAEPGAGGQARVRRPVRVQCRGRGRDPPRHRRPLRQCSRQVNKKDKTQHNIFTKSN